MCGCAVGGEKPVRPASGLQTMRGQNNETMSCRQSPQGFKICEPKNEDNDPAKFEEFQKQMQPKSP